MKSFVTLLLLFVTSLCIAQSKPAKTKKPAAKADSVVVKEIQRDPQTGKFLYPASMPDSVRLVQLENTINALFQLRQNDATYIQSLKTVHQHDLDELRGVIQQLQGQRPK